MDALSQASAQASPLRSHENAVDASVDSDSDKAAVAIGGLGAGGGKLAPIARAGRRAGPLGALPSLKDGVT